MLEPIAGEMVSGTTNSWELCDSALALFNEIFIYCEAYLVGTLESNVLGGC